MREDNMEQQLFKAKASVSASATTSSGSTAVALPAAGINISALNEGTVPVSFKFGTSTVTAATTDTPVEPGISRGFTRKPTDTHVAVITASGTATVIFTSGVGF
jgi:sugar (pentulose or hexulose) kinase